MAAPAALPAQFIVEEVSPSYWKVTFDNGPVNLIDAVSVEQLAELVARIEDSSAVTVVVFGSANPDYFMAHWDLRADRARVAAMAPGPTGLHPYLDNMVRLSKVPAVTICAIRGRVRGSRQRIRAGHRHPLCRRQGDPRSSRGGPRVGARRRADGAPGPAGRPRACG